MIITLCGTSRFKEAWYYYAAKLEHAGHTVYAMHTFHHADAIEYDEAEKVLLDLGHLKKIMESEAIFVVDGPNPESPQEDLYIGSSTRREIEWALLLDKMIYVASDGSADWLCRTPMEDMGFDLPDHIRNKPLSFG